MQIKPFTSLAEELGREVDITAVMTRLKFHFTELFACELEETGEN